MTARTLRPEDEISHYRIVGPLGAGGMGEVYLAQDLALGRNVALKILPPSLVRSEERVRRFVLEAKSASSLSHPNIVTIHEIGQETVRTAGVADANPVHYISMELVSGKTLSALIHEDRVELRTLIGYLAQAADGVAKAHAAGIVHRDLKPGNIMVTADGFAKVLDFGLAKLTESTDSGPDLTNAATVARDKTGEGMVVGTAGYMSPEQVQGKSVDHRSDIFSFGCLLYEAATRRRAFEAESSIETMHKILRDPPTPIEELNAKVPAELRRLIRRCLQKSPEQRLQSMKDLAIELREIEAEYDALSASASSGSISATGPVAAGRASVLPWVIVGVVVLAGVAVAWWALRGRQETPAFEKMRTTTVTNSGNVADVALSADGRYLAYQRTEGGLSRLSVHQVATGSDVDIVPAGLAPITNPAFSPDGNYIYYTSPSPEHQIYSVLYQVPSLGGTPREIAFDVDSRPSFSPDGKRLVFLRHLPEPPEERLLLLDIATRQERILGRIPNPLTFLGSPAWSPDGKHIAVVTFGGGNGVESIIAMFDPVTGNRQDWLKLTGPLLSSICWVRGGTALATTGQDLSVSIYDQVVLYPYPSGRPSRVTNDFNGYFSVSASMADDALAAVRQTRIGNIYLADAGGEPSRKLTSATNPENSFQQSAPADTGSAVCVAAKDGVLQLWSLDVTSGATRQLTEGERHSFQVRAASGTVVFDRIDSTGIHVWGMDREGGNVRKLTSGKGEQNQELSRDGRYVVVSRYDIRQAGRVISTSDGRVMQELSDIFGNALFSSDSRRLLVVHSVLVKDRAMARVDIVPVGGGPTQASVMLPPNAAQTRWGADEQSIIYLDRGDPGGNVFRQPLAGGPRVQLTHVSNGTVRGAALSPDGLHLGYTVRSGPNVEIWVCGADGGDARRVMQLSPEVIRDVNWMPDSRRVLVSADARSSDAVLIRGFR